MLGLKRPRQDEGLDLKCKKPRPWQASPRLGLADHDQSVRFGAPSFPLIDSTDGDEPENNTVGPTADHSPWKRARSAPTQGLVSYPVSAVSTPGPILPDDDLLAGVHGCQSSHALHISSSSISLGMDCLTLTTGGQATNANCMTGAMDGVAFPNDKVRLASTARLPSPISGDDMEMNRGDNTSHSAKTVYQLPRPSPSTIGMISTLPSGERAHTKTLASKFPAAKSKIVTGYRVDCEQCRRRVPGHYIHLRR
ncbi:hypothetical protein N7492_003687 [Penicillium capsulatum]|uniref:Uncharacterized protein n=1 Tax=Penicillium capsulatum TaxID=69766 RepID=A0A9W9IMK5_9EURO|nr:hypothetical protein N7492_003687 [Penicillium capsulatum]KAJ6121732.1 hypothetical protein N7512_004197 [Penicillium capsulatum]